MKKLILVLLATIFFGLSIDAQDIDNQKHNMNCYIMSLISNQSKIIKHNRLKSSEYQKLDSVIRPDYYKDVYMYDIEGNNTQYVYYELNNQNWLNSSKYDITYNSENNVSSFIYYIYDATNQWIVQYKYELTYTGSLISSLLELEFSNDQWITTSKTLYSYDLSNNLINSITYNWNLNNLSWENTEKYEYAYNTSNKRIQKLNNIWSNNLWSNTGKTTYDYDSKGNMILYTEFDWNTSNLLMPNYKGEFTYDIDNRSILTIHYTSSDGLQWVNARKIDYTYTYTCLTNNLRLPYFREFYYDEFVDITTASFIMHKWDANANNWYITYTKDKYFSDFIKITSMLSVSTNSLSIAAPTNSTKTFDITSNTTWTVASNQTWLTLSSESGSNNATITLTAEANPTASARTATVTVSGTEVTTQTITVTQDPVATGINDISKNSISMFPNPVTNELTINEISIYATISIFDLNGKLLINRIAKSTIEKIDLSSLAKGIYSIKVIDKKEVKTSKLIKQ